MIRRIETWLARIFRAELDCTATLLASELTAFRTGLARLEGAIEALAAVAESRAETGIAHAASEAAAHKAHIEKTVDGIGKKVAADYDALKGHIKEEILKRYDTLVRDAAAAARLMDASKIAMAICDYCHLASRRFSTSRIDGKIVCAACAAKGQN